MDILMQVHIIILSLNNLIIFIYQPDHHQHCRFLQVQSEQLVEHRSLQWEERRISSFACRTPTSLGSVADAGNRLGIASNGCRIFLKVRCRWHLRYTKLGERKLIIYLSGKDRKILKIFFK